MKAGGCWREMPESAAKRSAAAGWGLVWAHTAFVAENEAFRLCEVGRRVEGLGNLRGGKAGGNLRGGGKSAVWLLAAAGEVEGRKVEGLGKSRGGKAGGKSRGGEN